MFLGYERKPSRLNMNRKSTVKNSLKVTSTTFLPIHEILSCLQVQIEDTAVFRQDLRRLPPTVRCLNSE